jgi:hypothetical protein
MLRRELENLGERLLRGGIAPRHVRRYLRELNEHYDDALGAEQARGVDRTAAEQAAWARLGSEDSLVQSVLARPELRSTGARFPALVFGAGPLLVWLGVIFATVALVALVVALAVGAEPAARAEQAKPAWVLPAAHALCMVYLRVLPVVLGVVVLMAAAQRRLRAHWALAGSALLDILTGTLTIHVLSAKQFAVNSSLLPLLAWFSDEFGPRDFQAFGAGLARAAGMLAASAAIHAVSVRWAARRRATLV